MKYFSIKRDNTYPCFCLGCLVGKKQSEMSQKDARYCLECQPIIQYEYSLLADKGSWKRYKPTNPTGNLGAYEPLDLGMGMHKENVIKSTSNENPVRVDKIQATTPKRGRKKRELPEELIKQLQGKDMGSKAIATKLKERGIDVSYKTIQRVLAGERTA
jgi:hypothetical protein